MVNGYVTLDLASNNIYKESLGAIKSGKPVMVVDAPQVYFADTIKTATIDDDIVVEITKGGKTITITDANAVSSVGEIQNHLYALTFNVSDMYFTIYTRIKCGLNAKDINENSDDYSQVTLTNEEKTLLLNAIHSAISFNISHLIGSISGDNPGYVNFSTYNRIQFINADSDEYSILINCVNDITISLNAYNEAITLLEHQIY